MAASKTTTSGKATIHLPAPRDKNETNYEIVILNGKSYKIQKGVDVEVPTGVADILKMREEFRDVLYQRSMDLQM